MGPRSAHPPLPRLDRQPGVPAPARPPDPRALHEGVGARIPRGPVPEIMSARPVLLGIPWDESSSHLRGAAAAPPLIRAAFHAESSNAWTESGVELSADNVADAGDLEPVRGAAM